MQPTRLAAENGRLLCPPGWRRVKPVPPAPAGGYPTGVFPMPPIPNASPLGYIGVALLLFGLFLVLAGLGIIQMKEVAVSPGRKTWAVGGILVFLGGVFLAPDMAGLFSPTPSGTLTTAGTSTSTPTSKIAADPSMYDDFNNPTFDGNLDLGLWYPTVASPSYSEQRGGMLLLSLAPDAEEEAFLLSTESLKPGQFGFVESRLLLSGENTGQRGDIGLDLLAPAEGAQRLTFSCFIYRSVPPQVGCEVWGRGGGAEYVSEKKITNYDVWHTFRIAVTPEIYVTFFVDGHEAGSYRPPDAEELGAKALAFRLHIWSPDPDGITANFDDVRIGQLR